MHKSPFRGRAGWCRQIEWGVDLLGRVYRFQISRGDRTRGAAAEVDRGLDEAAGVIWHSLAQTIRQMMPLKAHYDSKAGTGRHKPAVSSSIAIRHAEGLLKHSPLPTRPTVVAFWGCSVNKAYG